MGQMDRLRELATKNDEYSRQEMQLQSSMQNAIEYREMKDTEQKVKLESSLKWGIFFSVEIVFMILITKGISHVLTLSMNKGMTQAEFIAAGGFGYRIIQVPMPLGAVLALPIAFLALFLVKQIKKSKVKKENKRNYQQNVMNRTENESIRTQNQSIMEHNRQISEQLEMLKRKKQELERQLGEENPLYPMEYLTVSIVDFVEKELQSGRAETINQALVHYEATTI